MTKKNKIDKSSITKGSVKHVFNADYSAQILFNKCQSNKQKYLLLDDDELELFTERMNNIDIIMKQQNINIDYDTVYLFDHDDLEKVCMGAENINCDILESNAMLKLYSRNINSKKYIYHDKNICLEKEEEMRFPEKLYKILSNEELASILSWTSNGNAFTIHKGKKFIRDIIPMYFDTSKWKSFQKQLNIYGFECTKDENRIATYRHRKFSQSQPQLVKEMKREKVWPRFRRKKSMQLKV